jgi:DNA-directed RNA polymerase subunit M/transcription elongation factor TFIIS
VDSASSEELEVKKKVEAAAKIAEKEHQKMRKRGCPICGSRNVIFAGRQRIVHRGNDIYVALEYYCNDCDKKYERELKLPNDYFLVMAHRVALEDAAHKGLEPIRA